MKYVQYSIKATVLMKYGSSWHQNQTNNEQLLKPRGSRMTVLLVFQICRRSRVISTFDLFHQRCNATQCTFIIIRVSQILVKICRTVLEITRQKGYCDLILSPKVDYFIPLSDGLLV